ncbi:LysR family transcriptional regulator [Gordonia sp. zg691]|uniref:LysR family transcriptional regulator n=1 Tax=Gordonia jinghuaiqii TaxID=2758710 RepID=A0A7D7LTC9_9ACTN|nr:LysR family transcriptional regulator [Gordonia jinghuaiqii]MBD0862313.1 LysR family transcriptional regulator [Gordonia jinghuaiqii]MCR5978463.1 LysR family transcriptional regulator [Gordonia jinghuaiqii]QMT02800.1 LysR family transcriptional regulator [Gordonia jinghuaiqii]
MDFRQLEYFTAVIEAGSVSQAAKNLRMTQPPVSQAIAKLERELGVRLLERTAKGVHPTRAGQFLLSNGSRLLTERDRIAETLALMGEAVVGDLRVGVEPMVINEFVAEVLAEFLDQAPGVRVTLTDATPDVILDGVRSGELDIGCVPFSPDQFADFVAEVCDWESIVRIEVKLAVPRFRQYESHPGGRGWGRWILPYPIPAFPGMPEVVTRALADDPTLEVLSVSTPQTAIPFVAAGLGVAPSTRKIAENRQGVALVDPPSWLKSMRGTVVWRRDAEVTPIMRRWIDVSRAVGEAAEDAFDA